MRRDREIGMLVACATPGERADVARAAEGLDWQALEALAAFHRVRPLLYRRALDAGVGPAEQRGAWERAFREGALEAMRLTAALIEVVRGMTEAGVPVLPHKGPLLALAAYGELGLRHSTDLDVLAPGERLGEAFAALAALGYRPDPALAWTPVSALRRYTGEFACGSAAGITVDLHWRLTPPTYPVQLDPAILWGQATSRTIGGAAVPDLRPEALFLLLAVHGAKHAWEAIGWLADLAWLIHATPAFDWTLARRLADQAGCARVLNLAAVLIGEVFDTPLPPPLAAAIAADPAAARLAAQVRRRWREGPVSSPRTGELLRFVAALSASRTATARHLVSLILDPTEVEWKARRLPEALFFLYAPGRLLRLASRAAVRVVRPKRPGHG